MFKIMTALRAYIKHKSTSTETVPNRSGEEILYIPLHSLTPTLRSHHDNVRHFNAPECTPRCSNSWYVWGIAVFRSQKKKTRRCGCEMDYQSGPVISPFDTQSVESYRHIFRHQNAATNAIGWGCENSCTPPLETSRQSSSSTPPQGG